MNASRFKVFAIDRNRLTLFFESQWRAVIFLIRGSQLVRPLWNRVVTQGILLIGKKRATPKAITAEAKLNNAPILAAS